MRSPSRFVPIFLTLVLAPSLAGAETFRVTPTSGGGGDAACAADPLNACNLQEAFNVAAANGADDTVELAAGNYSTLDNGPAPFTFNSGENFSLTLQGAGMDQTFLDGGATTQVLSVSATGAGSSVLITALAIQNGSAISPGAGLFLTVPNGTPQVIACAFTDNISTDGTGGLTISAAASSILVQNSVFTGNQGNEPFGAGAANLSSSTATITLEGNRFSQNTGNGDAGDSFSPGALFAQSTGGGVILRGNSFEGNQGSAGAFCPGGAFIQAFSVGNATLEDNIFLNNTSRGDSFSPGALFLQSFDIPFAMNRNTFEGNTGSAAGFSPGAVFTQIFDGDANLQSNTFLGNTTTGSGFSPGALWLAASGGTLVAANNILANNSSTTSEGGAAISGAEFPVTLVNNSFAGNTGAANGGGFSVRAGDAATTLNLYNNIAFGNSTSGTGQDIYIDNSVTPTVNLFNNDFGELCLSSPATCDFTVLGASQGGNLQEDPLFADVANGDLHLSAGSPAINAGDPAAPSLPATDHDGNPRIFGAAPDMGALEALGLLAISPASHDFGTVSLTQSGSVVVTISNVGAADLAVTGMSLSNTEDFFLNVQGGPDPCGSQSFTLAGGDSCTVTVEFAPETSGNFSADLTVTSNDPLQPSLTATFTGVGGASPFISGGGCSFGAPAPAIGLGWLLPLGLGLAFRGMMRRRA